VAEAPRRRIVVATGDTVAASMAGPGIRAWNLASELAAEHDVRLVTTAAADVEGAPFLLEAVDDGGLRAAMAWCDVFVTQGWVLAGRPFLTATDKVIVVDLYDPMHLEQLEQGHEAGTAAGRWAAVLDATAALNEQLLRGDLFMCASAKQRDFWLGQLAALGRVNPATYDADPGFHGLVVSVPFGVPSTPPVRTGPGVRGVVPGIGGDDLVVLWGGGIYNWFDPLTLLRAVDLLRARVPGVRLVFMGTRHPNPEIPEMRMAVEARRLASELGLVGTHVFFNDGWVPYHERQNVLLDADLGVSTHLDHIETEFSYRTRVLDYLWAGLPVVTTAGDAISALVEARGLGATVPPSDASALAGALEQLLRDRAARAACRERIAATVPELHWSAVSAPLLAFCRDPRRAADLADPWAARQIRLRSKLVPRTGWRHDAAVAMTYLQEGGVSLVAKRAATRMLRAAGLRRRV